MPSFLWRNAIKKMNQSHQRLKRIRHSAEPSSLRPATASISNPFQPRDIPSVVEEYLEQCIQSGFTKIRLIHGKGKGIQRNIVHALLSKHPAVVSFKDAPAEAGGWGSTIVLLKERN